MILVIVVYVSLKLWFRGPFYKKAELVDLDRLRREYTEEECVVDSFLTKEDFKPRRIPATIDKIMFD